MLSKQLLKITSLFAILFVILISCSKDNGGPAVSQTTVQEDKQNITSTFDGFYSCLNKLDDGDLSSFLLYSMFNNTSQVYNDSYLNTVFNKFKLQHGQLILNDKLQFASLTGIYTYNPVNSIWTKTSSSSVITLKFPSISTNNNVDSELTLNSYSDQNVIYNGKNKWLPTSASLSLKRNAANSTNASRATVKALQKLK